MATAAPWIAQFDAVADSGSSITCKWTIEANYSKQVRDLRVSLQPEFSAQATFSERLDPLQGQHTLQPLQANTRYKVCLSIVTKQLTDQRACVDVSTALGFMPALVGSAVGLLAAFLILACLVALSKYMQKRGVWVFRPPDKQPHPHSPEHKSLLSNAALNSKPANGPPTRTPVKVLRPEHLVEEIYCGEDDGPKTPPPPPPPPPAPEPVSPVKRIVTEALVSAESDSSEQPAAPTSMNTLSAQVQQPAEKVDHVVVSVQADALLGNDTDASLASPLASSSMPASSPSPPSEVVLELAQQQSQSQSQPHEPQSQQPGDILQCRDAETNGTTNDHSVRPNEQGSLNGTVVDKVATRPFTGIYMQFVETL